MHSHAQVWYAKRTLSPQAYIVFSHIELTGSITQREAIMDHSVQSLTRRITELKDKGFRISREDKKHPITGQRYARYSFTPVPSHA